MTIKGMANTWDEEELEILSLTENMGKQVGNYPIPLEALESSV